LHGPPPAPRLEVVMHTESNTADSAEALEAEALALTRAAQAVERWAKTAPEGSWGRKRLDGLVADLEYESRVSAEILCEVLAEKQANEAG